MLTKAIIQSINAAGTRCTVRIPLFETASNPNIVEAEALVNIPPGLFNSLEVGDIVFIAFEENAIEKPIILGKLFRGVDTENQARGGAGIFDTLKVRSSAAIPASTVYSFPDDIKQSYKDLNTPKKAADYIKWLEKVVKTLAQRIEGSFSCFKNWVQWQLKPENVEVDDGDIDLTTELPEPYLYQEEGKECHACAHCTKDNIRKYNNLSTDKNYPDI